MENMTIYNAVRNVPKEAQKEITAGRLRGKTDINPMWRIKTLTEQFGVAGIGWKTVVKAKWLEKNEATSEVAAFVDIDLYVKIDGQWSEPIEGTGGSMFVSIDKNGLYTDDEAYKKAYTDAISVACKALGVGADVYWDKDTTKYSPKPGAEEQPKTQPKAVPKAVPKAEPKPDPIPEPTETIVVGQLTNEGKILDALSLAHQKGKKIEMKHVRKWLTQKYGLEEDCDFNELKPEIVSALCKALIA